METPAKAAARWKGIAPLALGLALALLPAPAGLAPHAWRYFAIFATVIAGLVLEPLPGAVVGLMGVTLGTVLAPVVLFGPVELTQPGFRAPAAAINWALSGFSDATVWLIFGAYMFAMGYEKTGFGRRVSLLLVERMGKRTLTLGYAIAIADLLLAPFTPSNTARSGGTIFPVVRNLPPLYGSFPGDPSARRIGGYLMWVSIAAVSVTSSMFLTALAPNLLAVEMARRITQVEITWTNWFLACAPPGLILLALAPLLTYWIYPPEVKRGAEISRWAAGEIAALGPVSSGEVRLVLLVLLALVLWIFGGAYLSATTVTLIVISLMLVARVFTWGDVLSNASAWGTLVWFATLVAMADGLNRVGFVKWFASTVAGRLQGASPLAAMAALLLAFFFLHYLFASITAHTTALLPVLLAAGAAIPGMPVPQFALLLCLELGIMGILTPYATGPSPIYYGSGFLPPADYWRLGLIFGCVFILILLAVGVPWTAFLLRVSG
ncbi:MAG: anion permease [Bryobacterales bacterium]|nr:anion permease [Bryobacterales bacterium]